MSKDIETLTAGEQAAVRTGLAAARTDAGQTFSGPQAFGPRPTSSDTNPILEAGSLITLGDSMLAGALTNRHTPGATAVTGTGTSGVIRPGIVPISLSSATSSSNLTVGSIGLLLGGVISNSGGNNSCPLTDGFLVTYSHGTYGGIGGALMVGANAWGWLEIGGTSTYDTPSAAQSSSTQGAIGLEFAGGLRATGGSDANDTAYCRGYCWDGTSKTVTPWVLLQTISSRRCLDSFAIRYNPTGRLAEFFRISGNGKTSIGSITIPTILNDRLSGAVTLGATSTDTSSRAIIYYGSSSTILTPATF